MKYFCDWFIMATLDLVQKMMLILQVSYFMYVNKEVLSHMQL